MPTQQSYTFASHTSRHTNQSLQKSMPAQPKEKLKISPSKNFKNSPHNRYKPNTTMTAKPTADKEYSNSTDRTPASNRRLAKVAIQYSAYAFVVNQSLVLRIII